MCRPLGNEALPNISPRSLICSASSITGRDPGGTTMLRSIMWSFSLMNARCPASGLAQSNDCPTTCSFELMPNALLQSLPRTVPRSASTPRFHTNAWKARSPAVVPPPITVPSSLMPFAPEKLPPGVPRSVSFPLLQRKAWAVKSPARLDAPTI